MLTEPLKWNRGGGEGSCKRGLYNTPLHCCVRLPLGDGKKIEITQDEIWELSASKYQL